MKNKQLIECVPNISEGNDLEKIQEIAHVVKSVKGVQLLNIDSGNAANRTVFTFVGEPENVVEAAFLLIKKASELIDMSIQKGTHPRFGATDVCPLIPIANISMEETVKYAHKLGEKVGKELGISGYFYEFASIEEQKKNLVSIRSGEYEGLQEKIKKNDWQLDFGPKKYNEQIRKSGITAIGARNFLIAYNLNLNSTSVKLANQIASKIRESGSLVTHENGETVRIPGKLKAVKAIGWFLEDFGIAQVSCNLTNFQLNSMHQVFDEATKIGDEIGVKITGSELIGLVPLQAMIAAADFFLTLENKSTSIAEDEKIKFAIEKLGLNDIKPFHPKERIIEYAMNNVQTEIEIIPFENQYSKDFYELNAEWLRNYFYIEPYDEQVLSHPKEYILDKGGYIFLAKYQNEIVGVVSIINQKDFFELSKMAVKPNFRGQKIGEMLVKYCLEFGKNQGWESITLYSNRKLIPAITLYEKIGFKEVPLETNAHYNRADIKMIFEIDSFYTKL